MSCPLQGPASQTENQISMRQINARRSNLVAYVQVIHTDMEIPKIVRLCYSELRRKG